MNILITGIRSKYCERLSKGQSVFGEHLKSSEDQIHKSTCHVHVMR